MFREGNGCNSCGRKQLLLRQRGSIGCSGERNFRPRHLALLAAGSMLCAIRPAHVFAGPHARSGTICGRHFLGGLRAAASSAVAESYDKLATRLREINSLGGVMGALGWDEMVMMPVGAAAARGAQKAALAGVMHEKRTDPVLLALVDELAAAEGVAELEPREAAVVRDAKRDADLQRRLTKELAQREAELEVRAQSAWVAARKASNFSAFAPTLREMFDLKAEIAAAQHPDTAIYDGALDAFERGMTSERLDAIFDELKPRLADLLRRVQQKKHQEPGLTEVPAALKGGEQWAVDAQKALSLDVAKAFGFSTDNGRLDVSVHPFTGGSHPTDVRITTRYSQENWFEGIAGTAHETGHALYEQGRDTAPGFDGLPVTLALSMGVHESQSLTWERMVFQSKAFWEWATPALFHKHFPHTSSVTADDMYRYANRVKPGLIRVEADEVSYSLHIALRYELERGLFAKEFDINELPAMWSQRMEELLGVQVPTDATGCLQDVHWSVGAVGYFPTYTLGALMAAQLFATAKRELPGLEASIADGDFAPLRGWLRRSIHGVGSLHPSMDELLVDVTGEPLNPKFFLDYLDAKYTDLYDL